jgi:CRISPR system Cascade subunit CasD
MPCFLVFTLAGPLMAFGDVAPGERRVGVDRPGRSALLGMLAASLGLRREDERQQQLASSLAFAIRVDSPGETLVDYHTTQTAPARRGRRFATRREELEVDDLGTILSQRAYRTDAAFTVAAINVGDGPFSLRQIADSLARPMWPLHVGRRACPLGLPPAAALIEADDVPAALASYDNSEGKLP